MAQGSFSATVNAWVKETRERRDAVYRESARRVVEVMQEPGPSKATVKTAIAAGAGLGKAKASGGRGVSKWQYGPIANPGGAGNLPVDTGFLRASLVAVKGTGLPSLKPNPPEGKRFNYDPGQIDLVIMGCAITDPITLAYTAAYARVAEYGGEGRMARRFVALAAQQWSRIVDEVCREAEGGAKT